MDNSNHLYQTLCDLVEIMHRHGVVNVVLSPGSRSAPLALTFLRSKKFDVYHIVDERAAAYFGLGLAKAFERPTVLVCTSGTAAYNYAPAVAEAYFQQIPLLVLTADRPTEWINQNDNQAIFQQNLYGRHVLQFEQMPTTYDLPQERTWAQQKTNEACLTAMGERRGPVHLNFPFREPFYPEAKRCLPTAGLDYVKKEDQSHHLSNVFWDDFSAVIQGGDRVWVLAGSSNEEVDARGLRRFCKQTGALLIADPLSGLHIDGQWYTYDQQLRIAEVPVPDVVISFGNHFLSKSLKQYLRTNRVTHHLHIQPYDGLSDPFSSINFLVKSSPSAFFKEASRHLKEMDRSMSKTDIGLLNHAVEVPEDAELAMASALIDVLPEGCVLHMGNSTPVRYLLHFNEQLKDRSISVHANRGTSGIDGCVSTAVGMAQDDDRIHILVVGDLSMYYDRNGLWHNYVPENFAIVVVNNAGGGIFKRIPGPKAQLELEEYFVNQQPTNFKSLATEHGFNYHRLNFEFPKEASSGQFDIEKWERLFLEVLV